MSDREWEVERLWLLKKKKKLAIKSRSKKDEDNAEHREFFPCDKDKKIRKESSYACLNLMSPLIPSPGPAISTSLLGTSGLPVSSSVYCLSGPLELI